MSTLCVPGLPRLQISFRRLCIALRHNLAMPLRPPGSSETHYSWLQVTVLVQFQMKTGQQVVFFINLPADLEEQIQETLSTTHKDNPFIWHTILTQQVQVLYDDAVWSMRDLVRSVEKVCDILSLLLLSEILIFAGTECKPTPCA